jgi:hypothetical protein
LDHAVAVDGVGTVSQNSHKINNTSYLNGKVTYAVWHRCAFKVRKNVDALGRPEGDEQAEVVGAEVANWNNCLCPVMWCATYLLT